MNLNMAWTFWDAASEEQLAEFHAQRQRELEVPRIVFWPISGGSNIWEIFTPICGEFLHPFHLTYIFQSGENPTNQPFWRH